MTTADAITELMTAAGKQIFGATVTDIQILREKKDENSIQIPRSVRVRRIRMRNRTNRVPKGLEVRK